jgi:hypothetical protein
VIACIVVVVSLVVGVGIICYRRGHRRGGYRTLIWLRLRLWFSHSYTSNRKITDSQ